MKTIATLSTAVLGACLLAAPSIGKASLPPTKSNDAQLKSAAIVKSTNRNPDQVAYIVMKTPSTGSHVPTIYRVYHGRVTNASSLSGVVYSDLSPAGSESVAGSLIRLDPSITLGPRR